ncbi:MAG: TonB-dependent receptor plug domain-containing protein, partial [Bacteroidota bacterium]|nr:TonB-dependent receptor plug domain-containing protein [Bacteroidota bacterium]
NDFCNYPDIFTLISVKFPEVQVENGPGGARGVYVRGQKSINLETEAVYEVDGMKVADISFVNPCEIGTIDIMKSGGTAVYGTQAVNGVVVIKTKGHWGQRLDQ